MCLPGGLAVSVSAVYVYTTSLDGTDNAQVFSTQVQVGICVLRQPHQPRCRVLEHQVFGRSICFGGEEVKSLEKKKIFLCKHEINVYMNPSSSFFCCHDSLPALCAFYYWAFIPLQRLSWGHSRLSRPVWGPCGCTRHELGLWPGGSFYSCQ